MLSVNQMLVYHTVMEAPEAYIITNKTASEQLQNKLKINIDVSTENKLPLPEQTEDIKLCK